MRILYSISSVYRFRSDGRTKTSFVCFNSSDLVRHCENGYCRYIIYVITDVTTDNFNRILTNILLIITYYKNETRDRVQILEEFVCKTCFSQSTKDAILVEVSKNENMWNIIMGDLLLSEFQTFTDLR